MSKRNLLKVVEQDNMVLVDMSTGTQEYGYQQTADKHQDSVDTDMDDYDSKL